MSAASAISLVLTVGGAVLVASAFITWLGRRSE